MSNFINEASAELEHVVWPTPTENKKYMMYTIGVIVVLGIFLAILGFLVSNGLTLARAQFPHEMVAPAVSGEDTMNQQELDDLIKNMKIDTETVSNSSGTVNTTTSGTTATGSK